MNELVSVNHVPEPGRPYVKQKWWKIPVGCFLAVFLLGAASFGFAWFVMSTFRHSDAYQQAVARAQSNPTIVGELGTPIKPGWFASGEIEVNGSTGKARIEIPLSGPKNHGTLSVDSEKIAGQWHFRVLQFRVSGHQESIDLLNEPSENPSNPRGKSSPP